MVIEALESGLPPDKDTFGKALDAALHALDAEEYDDCPALIPRDGWRIIDDLQFELEPAEPTGSCCGDGATAGRPPS